ncbi:pentatricopeptide repeat-containing protein At2g29760, chloroplastic-like [Wolffia australiana]
MVLTGLVLSQASHPPCSTSLPAAPPLSKPINPFKSPRLPSQIHAHLILTGAIHHSASLHRLSLSCNSLLRSLVNLNLPFTALLTFSELTQQWNFSPDRFTYPSLLKACAQSSSSFEGRTLHGQLLKLGLAGDSFVVGTLISMYASCSDPQSAMAVFNQTGGSGNQVIWSSIISGLAKNKYPEEALRLFLEMEETHVESDEVTLTSAVSACAELKDLAMAMKLSSAISKERRKSSAVDRAEEMFEEMPERDLAARVRSSNSIVMLETAVVDMYAKCGALDLAKKMFDEMPERNVVTWSAMISGLAQHGRGEEALALFRTMLEEGSVAPNPVTLSAALSACAQTGDLSSGTWIHAYIVRSGMSFTAGLRNSLVNMYAKCGSVGAACRTFEVAAAEKDLVSWNVIISGLAMNGQGAQALETFRQMQREGMKPDDVTFVAVLSACSHSGLVEEGRRHYGSMEEVYGIRPKLEHDGCMVDMLIRAGKVEEAEEFVRRMEGEPGREVLGALLSGYAVFGELRRGEVVARRLLREVQPAQDGSYVAYCNMLKGRGRRGEAKRIREMMEERGAKKIPGCSTIDVDGVVFEFFSGEGLGQELCELQS